MVVNNSFPDVVFTHVTHVTRHESVTMWRCHTPLLCCKHQSWKCVLKYNLTDIICHRTVISSWFASHWFHNPRGNINNITVCGVNWLIVNTKMILLSDKKSSIWSTNERVIQAVWTNWKTVIYPNKYLALRSWDKPCRQQVSGSGELELLFTLVGHLTFRFWRQQEARPVSGQWLTQTQIQSRIMNHSHQIKYPSYLPPVPLKTLQQMIIFVLAHV